VFALGTNAGLSDSVKERVAVLEFEEVSNVGIQKAGLIIAEYMISHLGRVGRYDLVERPLLKKVLKEQQLQVEGGIVDPKTAVEIGKIYGVEAIVTGSVMKWADTYSLTARLIDTSTGRILRTSEASSSDLNRIPLKVELMALELSGQKVPEMSEQGHHFNAFLILLMFTVGIASIVLALSILSEP
jgi:TolB-like protein